MNDIIVIYLYLMID